MKEKAGKKKETKNVDYMEDLEDRYIRFDWAIKRLLRQKANFDVLEGFLTVFLGEKITVSEILESEGNQQTMDDKYNRVDIKALNSKGEIIIIEIQNTREAHFLERILYGVAKAITEHISLGDTYYKVKKVYSISILYFDLGQGNDYLYHGCNQFVGVHTHDRLLLNAKQEGALISRYPAEIFPEYILIRVNEFNKVAVTPLEEWVRYLKDGKIDPHTKAPGLSEAREKLKLYSMSKADRMAYERHLGNIMIQNDVVDTAHREGMIAGLAKGRAEGLEEGRAEGLIEGMEKGMEKGKEEGERLMNLENARKMKALHIASDIISQVTGLSAEEIATL